MKITLNLDLDQHDVTGIGIIITLFIFKAFRMIEDSTLCYCLMISTAFILGSNTDFMAGKGGTNGQNINFPKI